MPWPKIHWEDPLSLPEKQVEKPTWKYRAAGLYIPFGSFSLLDASVSFYHMKTHTYCPLSGQYLMHHWALSMCPTLPLNNLFQKQIP